MSVRNLQPLYFGPAARQLFGWLHRVHDTAPHATMGVVLCNPFGYEAVCAHRALRHLANTAVQLGIPSLRFDYDGSGDSAGDDFDSDRVAAWLTSVHAACDTLKLQTGVTQLCLLGVRFGALLAAQITGERDDVIALAAITPVIQGKTYLRELRTLQAAITANDDAGHDNSMLESAGFIMTAPTVAEIGKLEANTFTHKRVLIVDRADFPAARQWSEELQAANNHVEYQLTRDHEVLASPPHTLLLPEHIISTTRTWLSAVLTTASSSAPAAEQVSLATRAITNAVSMTLQTESASITETARFLDSTDSLFAIVTSANTPLQDNACDKRAVLLLNAGATHHIGAGRLYVTLARQLAQQGYVVMRLDLTGLGDSPAHDSSAENIVYCPHAARDITVAIETLQHHYGCADITAVGLCAGAYHSFKLALERAPFRSIVLINPLTFYWKEGMSLDTDFSAEEAAEITRRYKRRVLKLQTWQKPFASKAALKKLGRVILQRMANAINVRKRDIARVFGAALPEDLAADLQTIIRSGVRVSFIFSDRDLGLQRLRLQGGAAVARLIRKRQVELHLIKDADHTFTQAQHREQVVKLVTDVVQRH